MKNKTLLSFNIIQCVILFTVAAVLIYFINPVLSYIYGGISLFFIVTLKVVANKLKKKVKQNESEKDSE